MFSHRSITVTLFSVVCLIAATGCASNGTASPSPSPSATSSPTPAPSPLITIDSPAEGVTTSVPVTLRGTANTFEAALTVDALDESGDALCVRHIMATSGSGTPGTWETTLAFPPPDAVTVVTLRAYDFSAKDGSIENLVEREISISTERPPIFMTSPACGITVAPGESLTVAGRAFVFEAALTVELRDASGLVVVTRNVTALSGSEESSWEVSLPIPANLSSAMYDLVAFDYSAVDGSIQDEFSVQLLVRQG